MTTRNSDDLNNDIDDIVDTADDYQHSYEDDIASSDELSDDWVDDEQASEMQEEAPPKKKKSNFTLYAIIAALVVAGLGFVMLSGGGGQPSQSENVATSTPVINAEEAIDPVAQTANEPQSSELVPPPVQQPVSDEQQIAATDVQKPSDTPGMTGVMDDQAVVEKVGKELDTTVAPEVTELAKVESPAVDQPADKAVSLVDSVAPDIKPVSDFPTADAIKKVATAETSDEQAVTEPLPVKEEAPTLAVEPTPPASEVNLPQNEKGDREEVDALKAQIAELEAKISDMAQKNEVKQEESINDTVVSTIKEDTVAKEIQEPKEPKEPVRVLSNETSVSAKLTKSKAKPIWVLKGASSNKAIIYNKSTGDSKTVAVGDTVDGLGKILTISEENSVWVVKGTKSKLSE